MYNNNYNNYNKKRTRKKINKRYFKNNRTKKIKKINKNIYIKKKKINTNQKGSAHSEALRVKLSKLLKLSRIFNKPKLSSCDLGILLNLKNLFNIFKFNKMHESKDNELYQAVATFILKLKEDYNNNNFINEYVEQLNNLKAEHKNWRETVMHIEDFDPNHKSSIGSGNFGDVFKGTISIEGSQENIDVAQKTLNKKNLTDEDMFELIKEIIITQKICAGEKINIVGFQGVTFEDDKLSGLLLNFCNGGNLLDKIKKKDSTITENINYIKGIVNGMIHIHSLGFIHRDLATRNVLLNNNIPKISDFGSVIKENEAIMKLGFISPLWTHPTALKSKKFDKTTDIWSFGLTCWQIFSQGNSIYKFSMIVSNNFTNSEKIDIDSEKPDNISPLLWEFIKNCFNTGSKSDISFEDLKIKLKQIHIFGGYRKTSRNNRKTSRKKRKYKINPKKNTHKKKKKART